jgi:hypothetical protein
VALTSFQTFESLENAMEKIVITMSDCEFYERIYASSMLASNTVILQPEDTTEHFQATLKSALKQVYDAILTFVDRVKRFFEKPGFIGAFKPFSIEFQPLLDDIVKKEQIVRKLAEKKEIQGK